MAKIYTVKAKELFSHKTIQLDIVTDNVGKILFATPDEKDRKELLKRDLVNAETPEDAWQYWGRTKAVIQDTAKPQEAKL